MFRPVPVQTPAADWKYISIDIETLGLDSEHCDMIEFGAVLDDLKTPLEQLPRYHCYITRDGNRYKGEAYAMQMHQKILERIAKRTAGFNYVPHDCLDANFYNWLYQFGIAKDDLVVVGKNFATFDLKFLQKVGFGLPESLTQLHRRFLDVGSMYYNPLVSRFPPNLERCLEMAGVKKSVEHTAIADALDVIQCVRYKMDIANDPNT